MILGRDDIARLVKEKRLMENYDEKCLESSGYDLRVAKFYSASGETFLGKDERKLPSVQEIPEDVLLLKPGQYVLMETVERVNMPEDLAARVLNRSSLFRCGASTFNALVDPGYKGALTFGLKNISDHEVSIQRGAKVAQIVFEEFKGGTKPYSGRYQGGKVV
jgi:deoxycytidine triphosphate deaminase